jgi:hypothetical protein
VIIFDILISVLTIIWGWGLKNRYRGLSNWDRSLLDKLFFMHMAGGLAYYALVMISGGDAYAYWQFPKQFEFSQVWADIFARGRPTQFMYLFNYFPSNVLKLDFFTGTLIYSMLGYWGLLYLFLVIKKVVPNYQRLNRVKIFNVSIFPTLLFLPNLHFWSSGTTKDTLLFFAILLFIYSIMKPFKIVGIVFALALSFSLRPHITLFLLAAFGISLVLGGSLKIYQKAFIVLLAALLFSYLFNYVMSFANLDDFNSESIQQYSSAKAGHLTVKATSSVDISNYPYIYKVLTFLFRPLFFDINNAIAIIASFENLFLIFVTIKFIRFKPFGLIRKSNYLINGSLLFFIIGSLAFALILGNLGIMLREKNMLFPAYFITILWVFSVRGVRPKPQIIIKKDIDGN